MGTSLTSKVAKSAGWVFSAKILGRVFDLIKIVVLARLLSPEDFGLFGLVMLTIMILDIFSQTGTTSALIQQRENTHRYLNTAWTIQVIRGLILALILLLIAPMVGWFFKEPRIVKLLQFVCVVPIFQGFCNIGVIYFEKEMQFHKQFLFEMGSNLVSLVVGITLAFMLHTVWALIWANLSLAFMRLIFSYVLSSYRPKFRLMKSQAKELYRFGKWMSGYSMVLFCCQQLDKIFLGKFLGAGALGVYQVAQRVAELPASQIATASISFTFPAYAKIPENSERLGKAFLDVVETIMSLVLPLTIFIIFSASDIVISLLGESWSSAIVPLKILSLAGFLAALDSTTTPIFMASGKPNIEFWKNSLRLFVIISTIYPLTITWGITGTCMSLVLASTSPLLFWVKVKSITNIRWSDIFLKMVSPVIIGITTTLAIVLSHSLNVKPGIQTLAITAVSSLFFYIAIVFYMGRTYKKGIFVHVHRLLKGIVSGN
jgi:O-antigen/teichoic acid export membrane protein